ncbi:MAG: hypothetical protein AB1668_06395 [Nanoarchaeota archaeon]
MVNLKDSFLREILADVEALLVTVDNKLSTTENKEGISARAKIRQELVDGFSVISTKIKKKGGPLKFV